MGWFGFGKKKHAAAPPPPPQADAAARPGDRPLLRLLEHYVLDTIGELSPADQAVARTMTARAFDLDSVPDDWREVLRDKIHFGTTLDTAIVQSWPAQQARGVSPVTYAVDFAAEYFAPLLDGSVSRRGDREADPARAAEAEQRRQRSLAILRKQGVPTTPSLPTIETVATAKLRGAEEVARRAMVLGLVAARAEPDGLSEEEVRTFLAQRGVDGDLTPAERHFIALDDPPTEIRARFTWRYEGIVVLLWALGHFDKLGLPNEICSVPDVARLLFRADETFFKRATLRDAREILDEADLIYRYDWACVDARVNDRPPPTGIDPSIVYERHYALNWLIGYRGQAWDDVSTDT